MSKITVEIPPNALDRLKTIAFENDTTVEILAGVTLEGAADQMSPNWLKCADILPDHSGQYLCYDESEDKMWLGFYNDMGGQDTWGEDRRLGWVGMWDNPELWPTHWTEAPKPPLQSSSSAKSKEQKP